LEELTEDSDTTKSTTNDLLLYPLSYTRSYRDRSDKRQKTKHLCTEVIVEIPWPSKNKQQKKKKIGTRSLEAEENDFPKENDSAPRLLRALLDTGTTGMIVLKEHVPPGCMSCYKRPEATRWKTRGGNFYTRHKAMLDFEFPGLAPGKTISYNVHVDDTTNSDKIPYDMIIGTDLMQALGFDIQFSDQTIVWGETSIPMVEKGTYTNKQEIHLLYQMETESDAVQNMTQRAHWILDAKYKKADLNKVVQDSGLTLTSQDKLLHLLQQHEHLFDGTLGDWNTTPVDFELQEDVKPFHARPFTVPKIHEETLRKEVDRLVALGVLEKKNDSEWAAPTFIIPKKNGTVRFVSDFRQLNKRLKRKPFPIPKISELMLKLEGFSFAMSLDLNMGYYTIRLTPHASQLCTIILPWGKYQYK
jgi:hypothetical protein